VQMLAHCVGDYKCSRRQTSARTAQHVNRKTENEGNSMTTLQRLRMLHAITAFALLSSIPAEAGAASSRTASALLCAEGYTVVNNGSSERPVPNCRSSDGAPAK